MSTAPDILTNVVDIAFTRRDKLRGAFIAAGCSFFANEAKSAGHAFFIAQTP